MQRLQIKLNWAEQIPCTFKEEWKSIPVEIEEATKTVIYRQLIPDSKQET